MPPCFRSVIQSQSTGGGGNDQLTPSLPSETHLSSTMPTRAANYTYCLTFEPNMISADTPTCKLDPNIVNQ